MRQLLYSTLILVILISCNRNRQTTESQSIEEGVISTEQLEDMKEIYYRFPSPDEMLSFIDKEELNFDDDVLLPVQYARNYLDSKSQALNLGIYIADLAYITLFQRQKEALIYFQVVYGLSDKLRISSAFDPDLLQRIENNLNNPDSIKLYADEAMTDITDYLAQNEKEKTFTVISIGGFVESLYLAFNLTGDFDSDNLIVQRISDQKLVMENLINYSLDYAGDKNVAEVIEMLHPMRSVFNELTTTRIKTTVEKSEDGTLIISGGEKITMTEEQFNKLKTTTFAVRKLITENQEN